MVEGKKDHHGKPLLSMIPYTYWTENSDQYRLMKWFQLSERVLPRFDLATSPRDVADVMLLACQDAGGKYPRGNWMNGVPYSWLVDAALRHRCAIDKGEIVDPESGKPHAAHFQANISFLRLYEARDETPHDDRPCGTTPPQGVK